MGYKKSTVYKVYSKFRTYLTPVSRPKWTITNVKFNKSRYLPGERVYVSFYFKNKTDKDFYLYRIGVQTEWMKDQWVAKEVKDLVRPGQMRFFSLIFNIPEDLDLSLIHI